MDKYEVILFWEPGHSNVEGNEIAVELGRQGSGMYEGDADRLDIFTIQKE